MAPIHAKLGLPALSIWKSYLLPPLVIGQNCLNFKSFFIQVIISLESITGILDQINTFPNYKMHFCLVLSWHGLLVFGPSEKHS